MWPPALHSGAPFPSSVTVSEPQFLNQGNDDSGGYGFVGWGEDTTNTCKGNSVLSLAQGRGELLRAVVRVCAWLVCSSSTRRVSQCAFLLGLLFLSLHNGVPQDTSHC